MYENFNNHYNCALPVYNDVELLHFQLTSILTYFVFNFLRIILLHCGVTWSVLEPSQNFLSILHFLNFFRNLMYIDNPIGIGYNFSRNDKSYANNETKVARDIHNALVRFFKLFPELRNNNFFDIDESYDHKYIPAVSYIIKDYNIKI
ncbi:hypothetical protein HZH66_007664 [Vespula vulgaris]|uniref:Uncharacterized protein n=1 Tax=Vespula vulgaris TaxID=7454 RepID=A0A834JYJ2_VESVU|nr:hypothetical protein HZH66_007664 [Vespula vulgaris]